MLGTIEEEAAKCRKAHKDSKIGDLVWCCHHGLEIERLTEPAENRIKYILKFKLEVERALRLHEFRPVLGKLSKEFMAAWAKANADLAKAYADQAKAYTDLDKAKADLAKAKADLAKAYADQAKAYTDLDKANADRAKAYTDLDKAKADRDKVTEKYQPEITALHLQEVLDTTWNGKTILI